MPEEQPGTQTRISAPSAGAFHKRRDDPLLQGLPGLRLAKEVRDADEQVLLQQADLVGMIGQVPGVVVHGGDLPQRHPPADPPHEGAGFVAAKVVTDPGAQDIQDGPQAGVGLRRGRLVVPGRCDHLPGQVGDGPGDGVGRENRIRHARVDGVLRHIGELGVLRVLDDRPAAGGPDLREPQGAVAAAARQQDAAASVSPVVGQGAEEVVDRHQQAVAVDRRREREPILGDVEELLRRHDVDAVGQDRHAVGRLHHLQRRLTLQQFKQVFLREFGVMDQDDGHAPPGRQPAENLLEGLQGARSGPDTRHDSRGSTPGNLVVDGAVHMFCLPFLRFVLHMTLRDILVRGE